MVTATSGKPEGERDQTLPDPQRTVTAGTEIQHPTFNPTLIYLIIDQPAESSYGLILLILVSGMQPLLEEIMASPGLMESLLSGPYISNLLNCLSQNPDLAAQVTHSPTAGQFFPTMQFFV